MEVNATIQQIRQLISDADMEPAMDITRQLLEFQGNERLLVNLDLIESEFNHIKDQQLNGLLSADDQVRFYNINRAKLLELVLSISGEQALASTLQFKAGGQDAAPSRSAQNHQFKNGLKMVFGILFFMGAAGMFMNKEPLVPFLLKQVDPTPNSLLSTGAVDWADFSGRIHYIADLFRISHLDAALWEPPFSPEHTVEIKKNG